MAPVRCPLCGAAHATCGQRTTGVGIVITKGGPVMGGALKPYEVVTADGGTTTLLLSDEDAKARGLTAETVDVPVVARVEVDPARTKMRAPSNKARQNIDDK